MIELIMFMAGICTGATVAFKLEDHFKRTKNATH